MTTDPLTPRTATPSGSSRSSLASRSSTARRPPAPRLACLTALLDWRDAGEDVAAEPEQLAAEHDDGPQNHW